MMTFRLVTPLGLETRRNPMTGVYFTIDLGILSSSNNQSTKYWLKLANILSNNIANILAVLLT